MEHDFDAAYWQAHWRQASEGDDVRPIPASPYIETELGQLLPGTALDAGCGEGAEAIELATRGWRVTGADISAEALQRARARAEGAAGRPTWLEADLGRWEPDEPFDLVTTFYAHPDMPQLAFYARIAEWVAPGGTLLIVGHLHEPTDASGRHAHDDESGGHSGGHAHAGQPGGHGDGHAHGEHPPEASVRAADVAALLEAERWLVVTADERQRAVADREGRPRVLRDVIVRATRR